MEKRDTVRTLLAANGTQISMIGEVEVEVGVGSLKHRLVFIVSDQIDTVILGLDYLIGNQCTIDFANREMIIMNVQVQLQDRSESEQSCCRKIIVAKQGRVPPRAQVDIEVKMVHPNLRIQDRCWVTNAGNLSQPGILLARTLLKETADRAFVRIINLTHSDMILQKGMRLCNAIEVEQVATTQTLKCKQEQEGGNLVLFPHPYSKTLPICVLGTHCQA